ncbi:MAG TPA: hypothetical protein VD971_03150, partial [Phycisphaerales bacterium]|nr:hypothetical protein [Phycisphaerales bacterium]
MRVPQDLATPSRLLATLLGAVAITVCVQEVCADIDPVSGIDMVTIGAAGNAPWQGNGTPFDQTIGRGSVGYEYRIGKFEVSTANWVEFYNAAYDRPPTDWIPYVLPPQEDGW